MWEPDMPCGSMSEDNAIIADTLAQSCTEECQRSNTATFCHRQHCRAQCSECYYSKICLPGKSKHSRSCCLSFKGHYGCKYRSASLKLCQTCVNMSVEEGNLRREARDRFLIRRSASRMVLCSACGTELQNNRPLWWVCSKCSRECEDHIHPPWFERTDV